MMKSKGVKSYIQNVYLPRNNIKEENIDPNEMMSEQIKFKRNTKIKQGIMKTTADALNIKIDYKTLSPPVDDNYINTTDKIQLVGN